MVQASSGTLVLTGLRLQSPQDVKNLQQNFEETLLSEKVVVASLQSVLFFLSGNGSRIDVGGQDIRAFSRIIFFGGIAQNFRVTNAMIAVLKHEEIEIFDPGLTKYSGFDKLAQYAELSCLGISIPNTLFGPYEEVHKKLPNLGEYPYIVKDILASRGNRNYLVDSPEEIIRILDDPEHDFVVQQYIPDAHDYRVLINKAHNSVAFRRKATDSSHLHNTSRGATAELVSYSALPQSVRADCETIIANSSNKMLGIDVLVVEDAHYVLECNVQPQIFTGAFVDEKKEFYKKTLLLREQS
jgi:glutathione synthase/RimK-type ligase-like ATP-grasp enzyme